MTVQDVNKKNVLVGIRFDEHTRELLDWALVKVADPGDRVIAVHFCRNSDSKLKVLLDGYLDDYEGLCNEKQIDLIGEVLKGNSIRKDLVREAKRRGAIAVILGISKPNPIRDWVSIAKYCAKKLPLTTEILAIHNGKVVFRRCSTSKLQDFGDPRPSIYLSGTPISKYVPSEFGDSEISEFGRSSHEGTQSLEDGWREDNGNNKVGKLSLEKHNRALSEVSGCMDHSQQRPGWPLLRTGSTVSTPPAHEARKMSVVQWVMNLPNRSVPVSPGSNSSVDSIKSDFFLGRESSYFSNKDERDDISKGIELPEALELLKTNSSGCKWFSLEVLETSTSQFSSKYLIGKGGCNCVYKGLLPGGKPVAVKLLKSSRDAWKDFSQEVDIMTSLNHNNITPLLGICVEENHLISVYDFMPRGNLEENLYDTGNNKDKSVLSWEVRFSVAIGIAEALNYLHNECSQPVIHRDVKSSNILLSDDYKPLLSDFGLAIWGPTTSSFITHTDVVGTFGYLAPEYFMYGKVSDKLDVYSFGVVLLELLTGKKPIGLETPKGQESLVMWAKPKLESGDLISILDPNLDINVDEVQIHRMALAATLCLIRAARLRPKMSQILKILRGEKDVDKGRNTQDEDQNELENQVDNDDEVYPDSCKESHLGVALLDMDEEESTSFSSGDQNSTLSLEEYLRQRWSRSLSLD